MQNLFINYYCYYYYYYFSFFGGGGGINKVHYGLCENGEW